MRPDGQPLVVQLVYAPQWGDVAMHVLAKEYWEAVGVKVELREVSSEAYRTMASNNDHDVATTNSGLTTTDFNHTSFCANEVAANSKTRLSQSPAVKGAPNTTSNRKGTMCFYIALYLNTST